MVGPFAPLGAVRLEPPLTGRTGVLCIFACFAFGMANIFAHPIIIVFAIVCLCVLAPARVCAAGLLTLRSCYSPVIVFIEIPLLLRICPTSAKFDAIIRKITTNYMRAAVYIAMSAVQFVSLAKSVTTLLVAAVLLLFAGVFYALAGLKGQGFVGSKTLGGQGVAQMIV